MLYTLCTSSVPVSLGLPSPGRKNSLRVLGRGEVVVCSFRKGFLGVGRNDGEELTLTPKSHVDEG